MGKGRDNLTKHKRYMIASYLCMFLALFSVVFALFAYVFAYRVSLAEDSEVWIHSHSLWVMRNVLIFIFLAVFSALWFIPLCFFAWNSALWVTACVVIGVIFSAIAWLFLLNAWIQGMIKYFKSKAVF